MAIRSSATVWPTQPCRRQAVILLPRLPYSSSTTISRQLIKHSSGMLRSVARRSTSHEDSSTPLQTAMEKAEEEEEDEVVLEGPGSFRIYNSGKVERLNQPTLMPAGLDAATGVVSKDVVVDADTGVSVRLYLPRLTSSSEKKKKLLPVLVYFHGGAFMIGSADDFAYHNYVNSLAAAAGVLAVSVNYRLAPEHPLPAAYDDAWAALQWAVAGEDEWIAAHGDTSRLFLAGDSAGGNIAHEMLVRASTAINGPRAEGAILLHPWFGGAAAIEGEPREAAILTETIWSYACPGAVDGADDPRMNPLAPGALDELPCERVLVAAGMRDGLSVRMRAYYDAVASGGSAAEWVGSEGESHVFFLGKPGCENAKLLMDRVAAFISAGAS